MGRGYSGNHPRFSKRGDERYDAKEAYNKDLTASARLHYLENDRHDHESPNHMSVNQRLDDSFGMGQNTNKTPSPMKAHTRAHKLREKAIKISERSGAERGDEYDYENPRVMKLVDKANKADERSMKKAFAGAAEAAAKAGGSEMKGNMTRHIKPLPKRKVNDERSGEIRNEMLDEMIDNRPDSPMNNLKGPVKDRVIEKIDNPQPPMPTRIERGMGFIPMPKNREEVLELRTGEEAVSYTHLRAHET